MAGEPAHAVVARKAAQLGRELIAARHAAEEQRNEPGQPRHAAWP